jgi:quinoprotein glucose dehydrogenase
MTMTKPYSLAALWLISCSAVGAYAAPPSVPQWVEMFDQGGADPKLTGIETPRGVKVEVVDEGPLAAGILHDGWSYHVEGGKVTRRRPVGAEILKAALAASDAERGPPTTTTADGRSIEQELIRGLSAKPVDASGGFASGLDGWIYLSIGGVANRAESWDGSKAFGLGSGAIFRFRPDGSHVQEFARGLASPAGPPAFDGVGNLFQSENNSAGSRLLHVLELGDYGWRNDLKTQRLDLPGTLPAIQSSEVKNVGGVLVYSGAAFPAVFQRLLIVPEPDAQVVRASVITEQDGTFAVASQFDLLRGDDKFHPRQVKQGPDGAIYVDGERRIFRLTWSGKDDMPAIPLPALAVEAPPAPALSREAALALLADATKLTSARAAALAAAAQQWDASVLDALLTLVADKNADLARLAADAIGEHLPDDKLAQENLAGVMQQHLLRSPPAVQRSLYLALGKLGTKLDTVPEWIFEATSVTPQVQANRHTFDGHVRAAEIPEGWAAELLIGNLDVALFDPNPEPEERQRLKLFVTKTAEAMRTKELAVFLDRLIRDEKDCFSKLDAPLQARLLAAYPNVLIEPPARVDAVALWLSKHPLAAAEVQQAAWETLATLGTEKPDSLVIAARELLAAKRDAKLKALAAKALDPHRLAGKRSEIDDLLDQLQGR